MSGHYASYLQAQLEGAADRVNILTDDIRLILIDVADYTVNLATHDFLDDIPAAARVKVSGSLAGKSSTGGVFNHTAAVLTAVTGDPSEAVIYYKHTGVESTSRLMVYVDAASSGLPVTPNGGDITITPDTGANKAFKI